MPAFHEKPPRLMAERLLTSGALWNTFVMVGHVNAFLQMAWTAVPGVLEVFQSTMRAPTETAKHGLPIRYTIGFLRRTFRGRSYRPAARHLVALRLA